MSLTGLFPLKASRAFAIIDACNSDGYVQLETEELVK
jgi:hypothetical protein